MFKCTLLCKPLNDKDMASTVLRHELCFSKQRQIEQVSRITRLAFGENVLK